jgi:hypothetical protein
MTFKHTQFEDSATMRSLTKVAQDKGWIKEIPTVKTAAAKVDLQPSNDFTENLLKLCSGLRASGFDKQAEEIENKFVNYKQAQSLYGVGNEKGEDLLHDAHPKGSHKMENVEGQEATFEDLLDKHEQFLNVVNSKPTGKLASSRNIIDAVKIVLADETSDEAAREYWQELLKEASSLVNTVLTNEDVSDWTYHASGLGANWMREAPESSTGLALKTTRGHLEVVLENLKNLSRQAPSMEGLKEFKANLNSIMALVRDGNNIAPKSKTNYVASASNIYSKADKTLQILRGEIASPAKTNQLTVPEITIKESPLHPLLQQVAALKSKINSWLAIRSISQNPSATKWITDESASLDDIAKRYGAVSEDQAENMTSPLQREMENEAKDINTFEGLWIKPRM